MSGTGPGVTSDVPAGGTSSSGAPGKTRRYRGHTPEERREQRRRRLLDAGLELFGTSGYQNTSVERICSTSGVTGRHFYEEFNSREALLVAVFDEVVGECMAAVVEAVEQAGPGFDAIVHAGIGAYVSTLLGDRRKVRVVTMEVMGISDELEGHRRGKGMLFAEFMMSTATSLIEAGVPIHGTDLTPVALVGAIHELTRAWAASGFDVPQQQVVDEAIRIVLAVALAPTPAAPT